MSLHTNHRALTAVAATGFLTLTFLVGVFPALEVQKTGRHPHTSKLTSEELRGREIYIKEGCNFCHTQFVRDLDIDKPYGRASTAKDYAMAKQPMLGTQRTGPDLANVGVRQPSELWNLIHLYNPRATVPQSAMPGYPWYFEEKDKAGADDTVVPIPEPYAPTGKTVVATDEAIGLVRYLQSLKQPKLEQ